MIADYHRLLAYTGLFFVDVGLLVKREFNVLRTDNKLFRGDPIKRIKGDTFLRKLWRHIRVAGWVEGGGGVYEIIWHYQLSREWELATVKRLVQFRLTASTISLRIFL